MIKPLFRNVLVKPEFKAETPGGIILPDSEKKEQYLTVIGIGEECVKVKKGDRIIPYPNAGIGIKHNEELLVLVQEESIMALME